MFLHSKPSEVTDVHRLNATTTIEATGRTGWCRSVRSAFTPAGSSSDPRLHLLVADRFRDPRLHDLEQKHGLLRSDRWQRKMERGRGRWAACASGCRAFGRRRIEWQSLGRPRSSGNHACRRIPHRDLRRLEEEQREFHDSSIAYALPRTSRVREFMAERRNCPQPPVPPVRKPQSDFPRAATAFPGVHLRARWAARSVGAPGRLPPPFQGAAYCLRLPNRNKPLT